MQVLFCKTEMFAVISFSFSSFLTKKKKKKKPRTVYIRRFSISSGSLMILSKALFQIRAKKKSIVFGSSINIRPNVELYMSPNLM